MDTDSKIRLSFLYKNDPFYSLCLSDLMKAPQRVKNKFLKEQKNLTATIKKLDHQKLTRLRQLNEEKKQFSLLMQNKLAPRVTIRNGSSVATERDSQRTLSSKTFLPLASSKSSWNCFSAKSNAGFPSRAGQNCSATRMPKLSKASSVPRGKL